MLNNIRSNLRKKMYRIESGYFSPFRKLKRHKKSEDGLLRQSVSPFTETPVPPQLNWSGTKFVISQQMSQFTHNDVTANFIADRCVIGRSLDSDGLDGRRFSLDQQCVANKFSNRGQITPFKAELLRPGAELHLHIAE